MRTVKYIPMALVVLFLLLISGVLFCRGEEKTEVNASTVDVVIYKGVTTSVNGFRHTFSIDKNLHYLASYITGDRLEVRSINPDNSVNAKAIFKTIGDDYVVNRVAWKDRQLIYSVIHGVKPITNDDNDYLNKTNDPKYLMEHSSIYLFDPANGEKKKLLPYGAQGIYPSPSGKVLALYNMFMGVEASAHNYLDIYTDDHGQQSRIELPKEINNPIVVSWDKSEECVYLVGSRNVPVTGVRDDGPHPVFVLIRIRLVDHTIKQISPSYAIKNQRLNYVVIKASDFAPPSFAAARDTGVFACTLDENTSPDGNNAVTITKFNSDGVEHKLSRFTADTKSWPENLRKLLVYKSTFSFQQVTPTPDGESVLLTGHPNDIKYDSYKNGSIISTTLYLWDLKNNRIDNCGVVPPICDAYGWLTDGLYYYSSSSINVANQRREDIVVIKYHK